MAIIHTEKHSYNLKFKIYYEKTFFNTKNVSNMSLKTGGGEKITFYHSWHANIDKIKTAASTMTTLHMT